MKNAPASSLAWSFFYCFIRIIKLREGLPKFMRGFRDGLAKNFVDFMRVSREGLV